jgi:deoxyguanosine kinase
MKFRSIAVEGPIGVGKTSFVELLARKTEAQKVLEKVDNPFLRDFYQDKQGSAFQAQLFFLLSRYRQLMELGQRDLFHQVALCDYIFPKDKIFAYLNLDDSELLIYDKLYAMLEPQAPKPDLVIFLQAETPRLIERIKRRKRDYEAEISEAYVAEVAKAYNYFFFNYTQTPLLVIDTNQIDFVHHEKELDDLIAQIRRMERGVQYYRPLSSSA